MSKKDRVNLVVDIVCLLLYLVVANPAFSGIGVHEWLSIGVFIVFIVHIMLHVDWIVAATKNAFLNPSWAVTGNWILNFLLLITFMLCMLSGIFISGDVLRAAGLYSEGYYFWDPVHSFSSKLLLALLIVHVVVHGKWFAHLFKKRK